MGSAVSTVIVPLYIKYRTKHLHSDNRIVEN